MFKEASDWVDVADIKGLWPNTQYECESLIIFEATTARQTTPQIRLLLRMAHCYPTPKVLSSFTLSPTRDYQETDSVSWSRRA